GISFTLTGGTGSSRARCRGSPHARPRGRGGAVPRPPARAGGGPLYPPPAPPPPHSAQDKDHTSASLQPGPTFNPGRASCMPGGTYPELELACVACGCGAERPLATAKATVAVTHRNPTAMRCTHVRALPSIVMSRCPPARRRVESVAVETAQVAASVP